MTRTDDEDPKGLTDWLRPIRHEPMLWPLVAVLALVAFTIGGGLLAFAVGLRSVPAMAALALLVVLSGDLVQREVRGSGAGPVTGAVAGFWAGSGAAAAAGFALGLF